MKNKQTSLKGTKIARHFWSEDFATLLEKEIKDMERRGILLWYSSEIAGSFIAPWQFAWNIDRYDLEVMAENYRYLP